MKRLIVGTADGVAVLGDDGGRALQLPGRAVCALATASWSTLWVALAGGEIWRCRDTSWELVARLDGADVGPKPDAAPVPDPHSGAGSEGGFEIHCLADTRANEEGGILVGTSGARLFRVGAMGCVEPVEGFDDAPGRATWYTPWGGPPDTRTISEDADRVYVNVHVGGILRSADGGRSFVPTIDIDADVHRVVTGGGGSVLAAAAEGLWLSDDQGETWRRTAEGLDETYCRSVAVCGETLLLSASAGPRGERAGLYRSCDGGRSFERCRGGLPEHLPGNVDSLCLDALPDGSLAAFTVASGEVYTSRDEGRTWERIATSLPAPRCLLVLP